MGFQNNEQTKFLRIKKQQQIMKQIERHNKEAAMHYKKYEMHKKKMDKLFKTLNDTSKLDELIEKDLEKKRK